MSIATRILEPEESIDAAGKASRIGVSTQNSARNNARTLVHELIKPLQNTSGLTIEFRPVPASPGPRDCALWQDRTTWQIILMPSAKSDLFLAFELRGDTVVGSDVRGGDVPDVNLAGLDGYEQGVSRRHVLLRPTHEKLYMIDLKSTNGTSINGLPATVGRAYALRDGDLLSLARLHIRIKIVRWPAPAA